MIQFVGFFSLIWLLVACESALPTPTATSLPTPTITPVPSATPSYQPGDHTEFLDVGDETRSFRLHVPQQTGRLPLFIGLHGGGSSGLELEQATGFSVLADEQGFYVVYPEGLGTPRGWLSEGGDTRDTEYLRVLITYLRTQLPIDADQIYVFGFSNGARMTHRVACDMADVVAGVVPVGGSFFNEFPCEPDRPVPILIIHDLNDEIAPFGGDAERPPIPTYANRWAERNNCTAEPTETPLGDIAYVTEWEACSASVTLYALAQRGHFWPGFEQAMGLPLPAGSFFATDLIWEFFFGDS